MKKIILKLKYWLSFVDKYGIIIFKKGVRNMAYTIYDVAKYFLEKEPNMSHKKLQKLCWYAYSWDRFINYNEEVNALDETFIEYERAEAWIHGAVFPNLYIDVRYEFRKKITSANSDLKTEVISFLNNIYNIYGKYTGEELESINHQEKPWLNARIGCHTFQQCKKELQLSDIIEEYKSRYA